MQENGSIRAERVGETSSLPSTVSTNPRGRTDTCQYLDGVKLTQAIVREYVRLLGGTFKKTEYGDYRLAFGSHRSDSREEYHASDLADIVGTARVMRGSHDNIDEAEALLASCVPVNVEVSK